MNTKKYTTQDLLEIIRTLRSENGCPWDKVQTHDSIKKSLIEESYEAIDALDAKDDRMFANELGDVLMQVAFHSVLAEERGAFGYDDVVYEICNKLITRHTHVFGNDKSADAEEALAVWEKNKKKEKGLKTDTDTLRDVPHSLPALMRAEKVQKKAAAVNFDWDNIDGAVDKLYEEIDEVKEAVRSGDAECIDEEIGDMLFAAVNVSRFAGVCPETSLSAATAKFINRFAKMEELAAADGTKLSELDAKQLEFLWQNAKKSTKNS